MSPTSRWRLIPAWAPGLLAFLCACGGGGGGALIQPPSQFTVTSSPLMDFDTLTFQWVAPQGPVTGYNLQGAVNGGPFEALNSSLIPPAAVGGTLSLYPSVPEMTSFVFRINAVSGSAHSDWAQAPYTRGIRPPESFMAAADPVNQRIRLSWVPRSAVAETHTLKRTAYPPAGGAPVVTTLPVQPATAGAYEDTDLREGFAYDYRLTSDKGAVSSAARESGSVYYALNGPTAFALQTGRDSVSLSWNLSSARSTAVRVYRNTLLGATPSPGANMPIAVLDPAARTYTDAGLAPGIYMYRVASYTDAGNNEASSGWVTGCTQPAPLGGMAFQAKWVPMPTAPWAQPLGQDHWLLWPASLDGQGYGVIDWSPTGSAQTTFTPRPEWDSEPPVILDGTGQPHMVYVDDAAQLVHAWHSSSGWQMEVVAQDADQISSLGYRGLPFLVGSDGSLRILFARRGAARTFEAVRGAGGWTLNEDPQLARMSNFALDASGALWGVELGWSGPEVPRPVILWSRGGDGAWSSRPVPGDGTYARVSFAMGADGAHLVFVKAADAAGPQGLVHLAQEGMGWAVPEYLSSASPSPNQPPYLSIAGPDQRLFFSADFEGGTMLFTRDGNGAWSSSNLLPFDYYPPHFIQGRTPDGKLFLVVWPYTGMREGTVVFTQP